MLTTTDLRRIADAIGRAMQLEGSLIGAGPSRSEDVIAKRRLASLERLQAKVLKELSDRKRAPK